MIVVLIFIAAMCYGPLAALMVELFPTRIRYTSMSLPYHIGNGWFGGVPADGVVCLGGVHRRYLLWLVVPGGGDGREPDRPGCSALKKPGMWISKTTDTSAL